MTATLEKHLADVEKLLDVAEQVWLLGAGISCESGIPLMRVLTERVDAIVQSPKKCLGLE